MRALHALVQLSGAWLAAASDCCWCDPTTPSDGTTTVGSDGDNYKLVFSDEFSDSDREFANGKDAKWTALNVGDTSNKGMAFYLPEQAVRHSSLEYHTTLFSWPSIMTLAPSTHDAV